MIDGRRGPDLMVCARISIDASASPLSLGRQSECPNSIVTIRMTSYHDHFSTIIPKNRLIYLNRKNHLSYESDNPPQSDP